MASRHPCQLHLSALTWEPDLDKRLVPSLSTVLSTISQLSFVSGLALCDLFDPRLFESGSWQCMPYAPSEGFSARTINREDVDDKVIIECLKESGPDWLGEVLEY